MSSKLQFQTIFLQHLNYYLPKPFVMSAAQKRRRRSSVWEHFLVKTENEVECQICEPKRIVKIFKGSTSGLHQHLQINHPSVLFGETCKFTTII